MCRAGILHLIALGVIGCCCGCATTQGSMSREETFKGSKSPDPGNRLAAAWMLSEYGDPEALARLREMASDSEPGVKGRALKAFGRWRDKQAIPILVSALLDEGTWKDCEERLLMHVLIRRYLSETAHKSLVQITGYRIRFDPEADVEKRKAVQGEWKRRLGPMISSEQLTSR